MLNLNFSGLLSYVSMTVVDGTTPVKSIWNLSHISFIFRI